MQLVIYSGGGKLYSRWMDLVINREAHQIRCKPANRARMQ